MSSETSQEDSGIPLFSRHSDYLLSQVFPENRPMLPVEAIIPDMGERPFTVSARDLLIAWGEDTRYWRWSRIHQSGGNQFEVAELLEVCWLEVNGYFDIRKLLPGITYEVIYVVMLKDSASGWEVPVNLRLFLPNGNKQERKENLKEKPRGEWLTISLGNFKASPEMVGNIKFTLDAYDNLACKRGLIIKAVVLKQK